MRTVFWSTFSHNSQTVQDGVAKRFVDEKTDALFMLDFGV